MLLFSDLSSVGSSKLVQSFNKEVMKVPIHCIHLQSGLITDFVEVGVRPILPVKVVDTPVTQHNTDDLSQKYLSAFPVCVVIQGQSKRGNDVSLSDYFLCTAEEAEKVTQVKAGDCDWLREVVVSSPMTISVTRVKLIKAQNSDPSLIVFQIG